MEKEKNNYNSAFIVKDAKTYVNAEEAWFQFRGKNEGSILFIVVPKNAPKITHDIFDEVIDTGKWEKIVWYRSYSNYAPRWFKRKKRDSWFYDKIMNTREYICNYLDRLRLDRLGKKYGPIDTVFSGHRNTQEHLAFALKPNELYIMDSGMGLQKRIHSTGYINDRKESKRHPIRYLLQWLINFKKFNRKQTKLFTVYSETIETKHQVIQNDYSYRKFLINRKKVGNNVFLVSSPIYNREHISVGVYIVFLKEILNELNINPKNVVYIPHPVYEKEEQISMIVNSLGCDVDSRDIPIESKITFYDTLPNMCISPYSSSIVNIASYVEDKISLVYAWHPELDCFSEIREWKEKSILKKQNIKLVPLEKVTSLFGFEKKDCDQPKYKNFEEWDLFLKKQTTHSSKITLLS